MADGTTADLSAAPECGDVLALLRASHCMSAAAGECPLARILPPPPGDDGSMRLRANFPENGVPELYLRAMPQSPVAQAAISRTFMFLALLPLLKAERIFLFHGGLAADADGNGCIFCGPSGVGKSTAVAKAGAMWEVLADDLLYLSFLDDGCYAQPGPTWSTYLTEKKRVAECDVNRAVKVKNAVILSRLGDVGIRRVTGSAAGLMLANSFVEMTAWMALCLRDQAASTQLKLHAFNGVQKLTSSVSCHVLTSELETDITPFLLALPR